jgi:hypothetical protein
MSEINTIINILNDISKKINYTVFIPSQNKEVTFKQLTTEQLKDLYTLAVNPSFTNLEFNIKFNNIIEANCLDDSVNPKNLTLYDKVLFFLNTKIKCISEDYRFLISDRELDEHNLDIDYVSCSILEHFNNIVKLEIPPLTKEIVWEDFKISCHVPSLDIESKFDKELLNVFANTNDISDIVSHTFIAEIVKFTKQIQINDKVINFESLSLSNSSSIIESLPVNAVKEVLLFIEESKKFINNVLTCSVIVNDNTILKKEIPYNGVFFNI